MYTCKECGKPYSNQNSLTRHAHNHRQAKKHTCSSCGVTFMRRDLLSRHEKIHDPVVDDTMTGGQSPQGAAAASIVSRRRTHTACTECRLARTKCDGSRPCGSCTNAEKRCEYDRNGHRLSQAAPTEPIQAAKRPAPDQLRTSRLTPGAPERSVNFGMLSPVERISDFLPDVPLEASHDTFGGMGNAALDPGSILDDTTAWPWIHEDLFLGNDWQAFNYHELQSGMYRPEIDDTTIPTEGMNQQLLEPSDFDNYSRQRTATRCGTPVFEGLLNPPSEQTCRTSVQLKLIEEMVSCAANASTLSETAESRGISWASLSSRVKAVFGLESGPEYTGHVLQNFVDLYLENFAPLWPLLAKQTFSYNLIHPTLYLTLVSIGLMYSSFPHRHFATMLHEGLRKSLLATAFEVEETEQDAIWLGQARSLTQVAALYFGQKRAFSYAQHLGSVLIAQARRMNLFSRPSRSRVNVGSRSLTPEEAVTTWIRAESRKRLAFGILRGESYTSVLLNTKPLVSFEEINLELPCSDLIWNKSMDSPSAYMEAVGNDRSSGGMLFSDILHVVLDRGEQHPSLDPMGYELAIFGLQSSVWSSSHDPRLYERLTGKNNVSKSEYVGLGQLPNPGTWLSMTSNDSICRTEDSRNRSLADDHLARGFHEMRDLNLDRDRLFGALQKWKRSFDLCRASRPLLENRNSILSSLLLYHISYLRLHSPIEDLHYISYRTAAARQQDENVLHDVYRWTKHSSAKIAAEHACMIWSIINLELQRPESSRARFNFLAFSGLHHAAAVLWVYASTHQEAATGVDEQNLALNLGGPAGKSLAVCSDNIQPILASFVQLYDTISPARWSSFAAAATKLAEFQFSYTACEAHLY